MIRTCIMYYGANDGTNFLAKCNHTKASLFLNARHVLKDLPIIIQLINITHHQVVNDMFINNAYSYMIMLEMLEFQV